MKVLKQTPLTPEEIESVLRGTLLPETLNAELYEYILDHHPEIAVLYEDG